MSAAIGGTTYSYFYDGLGRRNRSTTSGEGEATTYYYSAWRLAVDIHDSGAPRPDRTSAMPPRSESSVVRQEFIDYAFYRLFDDANFVRVIFQQCFGEVVCLLDRDVRGQGRHVRIGHRLDHDRPVRR